MKKSYPILVIVIATLLVASRLCRSGLNVGDYACYHYIGFGLEYDISVVVTSIHLFEITFNEEIAIDGAEMVTYDLYVDVSKEVGMIAKNHMQIGEVFAVSKNFSSIPLFVICINKVTKEYEGRSFFCNFLNGTTSQYGYLFELIYDDVTGFLLEARIYDLLSMELEVRQIVTKIGF